MFRGVVLALALGAMGCGRIGFDGLLGGDNAPGDDNPGDGGVQMDAPPLGALGDPDGYWVIDQFFDTVDNQLYTRTDAQNGGRGNWRIQGNSLEARDAVFTNSFPTRVRTGAADFSSTATTWRTVADGNSTTTVYDVTWVNAGHVSLVADVNAPGASPTPEYMSIEMTRIPAPVITSGVRTYTRFQYEGDIERPAGDCSAPSFLMGQHATMTGMLTLTLQYTFDHDVHEVLYADDTCMTQADVVDEQIDNAYMELGPDTFESWADVNHDGHYLVHVTGTLELTTNRIRFTRLTCETSRPPCDRPILVEMTR